MGYHMANYDEPLISEISSRNDYKLPGLDINDESVIPASLKRSTLNLPDVSEFDVVRHFTRLSQMNYGVDLGMYPLGSCTMKFNPKFADKISSLQSFTYGHPLETEATAQGYLTIMYELQEFLKEISDMDAITLQPRAGAHGEFTGVLIIRNYLKDKGELSRRREIIIPDSAHGTNPASATMAGFDVVEIPSGKDGTVDLDALKYALTEKTAALMITNPNTLGIFEHDIKEIAKLVHDNGSLLYYDGANLNAIMGITSPGRMGFDVVHFNLHKTFGTPHGGGGPGAGPIAVKSFLKDFLPVPTVSKDGDRLFLDYSASKTIGKVASYYGSFNTILRAWAYIRYMGGNGLRNASERAVLNSNYLAKKLSARFEIPFEKIKKHEFVLTTENTGKKALDLAKFLIDNGIHAPTIYFPLIVHEAMMIEPTESASKRDLDNFAEFLIKGLELSSEEISRLPKNLPVGRIDEVKAARDMKTTWSLQ